MGELARQRRARDLWISRGHLWALSVGVVLLAVCSFFVGMALARSAPASASAPAPEAGFSAPEESLVDLLARVDARAVAQDGVDTLTFPDTLTGVAEDPGVPLPGAESDGGAVVAAGQVGLRPMDLVLTLSDADDARALQDALAVEGFESRLVEGEDEVALVIVGGEDVEAARATRAALLDALGAMDRSVPVALRSRAE